MFNVSRRGWLPTDRWLASWSIPTANLNTNQLQNNILCKQIKHSTHETWTFFLGANRQSCTFLSTFKILNNVRQSSVECQGNVFGTGREPGQLINAANWVVVWPFDVKFLRVTCLLLWYYTKCRGDGGAASARRTIPRVKVNRNCHFTLL